MVINKSSSRRWSTTTIFRGILFLIIVALAMRLISRSRQPNPNLSPLEELNIAIRTDDVENVRRLLQQKIDLKGKLKDGGTLWDNLPTYIYRDSPPQILQMLLDYGVDPNARTSSGTPLIMSVNADPRLVKLLLKRGAKADARDKDGANALLGSGNEEAIRLLIVAGANVRVRSSNGTTPLMSAAYMQGYRGGGASAGGSPVLWQEGQTSVSLFTLLLEKGAGLEDRNNLGQTALLIAAQRQNRKIVEFLIEKGANVHVVDNENKNALNYAMDNPDPAVGELLLSKGVKYQPSPERDSFLLLNLAGYPTDKRRLSLALCCGIDTNIRDKKGDTALLKATYIQNSSLVMQAAQNIYSKTDIRTRLARATKQIAGHPAIYEEAVELLLNKGADPNIANKEGWTPLLAATANNNVPMVKMLLSHGAKVNQAMPTGITPLRIAQAYRYTEIERLLREKDA